MGQMADVRGDERSVGEGTVPGGVDSSEEFWSSKELWRFAEIQGSFDSALRAALRMTAAWGLR